LRSDEQKAYRAESWVPQKSRGVFNHQVKYDAILKYDAVSGGRLYRLEPVLVDSQVRDFGFERLPGYAEDSGRAGWAANHCAVTPNRRRDPSMRDRGAM